MTDEFNNQWAVILGGSSGLGLASAQKLAQYGMNICIVHRDRKSNLPAFEEAVDEIKRNGVKVITLNKDALLEETRMAVIDMIPKKSIKLLLHSVAKGSLKPMNASEGSLSKTDLDITLHAMAISWYEWASNFLKEDLFTENARSIAFTSEGSTKVWPGYGAVSAAKATLESLMRSMAVAFAPNKITTNCIQAGATETPSFLMIPGSDKLAGMAQKRNPFQKLTQPKDVANAVYLLCKDEANWINGTILKVDGGESLR